MHITDLLMSNKFKLFFDLPKKKSEREQILLDVSKNDKTTIIYESPHRLQKLLLELKEH